MSMALSQGQVQRQSPMSVMKMAMGMPNNKIRHFQKLMSTNNVDTILHVAQPRLFEVLSSMKNVDEDMVYSVAEGYSRKAIEPTTRRSSTTSSLILMENLVFLKWRTRFYLWNCNLINLILHK